MRTVALLPEAAEAALPPAEAAGAPAPEGMPEVLEECLYLTGRPTLKRFLRFVRTHAAHPPGKGALRDEWLAAHQVLRSLEREEAGLADAPPLTPLVGRPEYEPLLVALLQDPLVRHGFNTVPTEIALVELDRLVVYQKHIDLTHVRALQGRLGPAPSGEAIFRTCLPADHPQPPVRWARLPGDRFVFVSPSNDLRFLGSLPLKPSHLQGLPPPGNLVGVAGIAVGFGSNFLNAIAAEGRLILNNGSHRAYALRGLGVTHVPCIIQHPASRDEVEVVAASEVEDDPDYYLRHPRPPLLKDYFDPRLRTILQVPRRLRQITVRFEVEQSYVPAL